MAAVPSVGRASEVEAPGAGEGAAAGELYARYSQRIYRYCLNRLRSREEAEDATQTTFLNAFRGLQRGVTPEVEQAWLYKIAENVCLTRVRSSVRRLRVESPTDLDPLHELVAAPQRDGDELHGIADALATLPEQQRRAILLREWQGLSYKEIAAELGVSQGAVETLLFRARRSLARALERGDERRGGLRKGANLGSIAAWLKSIVVGGSTAAKVAAVIAAGSAVVVAGAERPGDHTPATKERRTVAAAVTPAAFAHVHLQRPHDSGRRSAAHRVTHSPRTKSASAPSARVAKNDSRRWAQHVPAETERPTSDRSSSIPSENPSVAPAAGTEKTQPVTPAPPPPTERTAPSKDDDEVEKPEPVEPANPAPPHPQPEEPTLPPAARSKGGEKQAPERPGHSDDDTNKP